MSFRFLIASVLMVAAMDLVQAAPRDLAPVPVGNQALFYSHGTPFVFSEARESALQLSVESIDSRRVWISLSFTNLGDDPVSVMENPVQAIAAMPDSQAIINVITGSELERRERRRQVWEEIGAGVASGLNTYGASQQGHGSATSRHSGTVRGYGSRSGHVRGNYSGTSTTRFFDPSANQAALARAADENRQMLDSLRNDQALREEALSSSVLKTHTLAAGETYSGRLQLELPRRQSNRPLLLRVDIGIGNELHPFLLEIDGRVPSELVHRANQAAERALANIQRDARTVQSPQVGGSALLTSDLGNSLRSAEASEHSAIEVVRSESRRSDPDTRSVSSTGSKTLSESRPNGHAAIANGSAVFRGELRPIETPIRISLNDSDYEQAFEFSVEGENDSGVTRELMAVRTGSTVTQDRSGDLVSHEVKFTSAEFKGGAGALGLGDELEGASLLYETSPEGQMKGAAILTDKQGRTEEDQEDLASFIAPRVTFSSSAVKSDDVAATSTFLPNAVLGDQRTIFGDFLDRQLEWTLAGGVLYSGKDAYLLTVTRSSTREGATDDGVPIRQESSVNGFSVVDSNSGVVLQQKMNLISTVYREEKRMVEIRVQVSREAKSKADAPSSRWTPSLVKITSTSVRKDDGSIADQLFIDLSWRGGSSRSGAIGRLVIRHKEVGQSVSLPWEIPESVLRGGGGADTGFGFEVSALGEAARWLPSASLRQLEVTFIPNN